MVQELTRQVIAGNHIFFLNLKLYLMNWLRNNLSKSISAGSDRAGRTGSSRISNIWSKILIFCSISNAEKKSIVSEISHCFDFPCDCGNKLSTASSLRFARNNRTVKCDRYSIQALFWSIKVIFFIISWELNSLRHLFNFHQCHCRHGFEKFEILNLTAIPWSITSYISWMT